MLIFASAAWAQNPGPLMVDGDGDGVSDEKDDCPYTPPGVAVDARGCPTQGDADGDGVPDAMDDCPYTPKGARVDAHGCALDGDFDGVPDGLDQCPRTPLGERVNEFGCMPGEKPGSPVRASSKAAATDGNPAALKAFKPKPSRAQSTTSKALDDAIEAALAAAARSESAVAPVGVAVAPEPAVVASAPPPPPPAPAPAQPPSPPVEPPTAVSPVAVPASVEIAAAPTVAPSVTTPLPAETATPTPTPMAAPVAVESVPVPVPVPSAVVAALPQAPSTEPASTAPQLPSVVAPVVAVMPPASETAKPFLGTIEFPKNSVELPEKAFSQLHEIAALAAIHIAAEPGTTVQVKGSAQKDEKAGLDQQRAALVRAYLMAQGLDPDQVRLGSSGKTGKATVGDGSRQVELKLLPPG